MFGSRATCFGLDIGRRAVVKPQGKSKPERGLPTMYIKIHETETKLTISIDLGRIKRDAANAEEARSVMPAIGKLEWAAMALNAWLEARMSPF